MEVTTFKETDERTVYIRSRIRASLVKSEEEEDYYYWTGTSYCSSNSKHKNRTCTKVLSPLMQRLDLCGETRKTQMRSYLHGHITCTCQYVGTRMYSAEQVLPTCTVLCCICVEVACSLLKRTELI